MKGTLTKLLTAVPLFFSLFSHWGYSQCALITDNYSGQVAGSVCAPVNLNMDVRYKFILPVDPSRVQILYVWNDGTGATTTVPAISQGDTIFTATAAHLYQPSDQCSYTAEAYVVFDGQQCVSSSRQEQTFSAWARDNENGAVVITDPVVAQFCEGEDIIDVRFRDNSTFNCNINIEPDKPNRITRWVQFIYGTTSIGGDRIPNITIRDPLGNVYQMTDAMGNSLPPISGPIVEIPIPADGPTEISWPISAPAGGLAGDIFEITLRNWNICNPYDHNPFDSIPPSDLINGDNDPITTTALIEIITTPPEISNPSLEFCAGSPINLTLSTSGGNVNWYADSAMTTLIHTGNSFDPTGSPTYIDNSVGGIYSYWVTETIGECASAPSRVSFEIFDTPAPAPNAGNDTVICDNSYIIHANIPVIGSGEWSTTSSAIIADRFNPVTSVSNLAEGENHFLWTIRNGPCVSEDEVIITRDLQPSPALAGPDRSFCNTSAITLQGNIPTNNGIGTWTTATGNADFDDAHDPDTDASNLQGGRNFLAWTIYSRYGACLTTSDTVMILRDLNPDPAFAGADRGICDSTTINLAALPAGNNGLGTWIVINGAGIINDINSNNSSVSNLSFGVNEFRWEVISEFGICPGSSDNVRIIRDIAPDPAFAGNDQLLCSQITTPLGANSASIGTGTWNVISSPTAVSPVLNPSINAPNATMLITSGNEGIYNLAWTIVNGSCHTSDTVRIDFGLPVPPANAGLPDTICGTDAILNANNAGIGTGTWTKISGAGNVSFIPDEHINSAIARIQTEQEGLYSFEWRITSGSCPSTSDTVLIFYKPQPGIPSAADQSRCGPGSFNLTSTTGINGDINRWYESATSFSYLTEGNNFTTPVLSASGDYWVSSYDLSVGCESYRRQVNVIVNEIPSLAGVNNVQNCGSTSLTLPSIVGTNGIINRWYDANTGGTLLAEDYTYNTPVLNSPVTYWVSSYNSITGCESGRSPLHVQIDPIPGAPLVKDTGRCGQGTIIINSATGANGEYNLWYDAQTGGALLDTTNIFTTPYLTTSTSYWVTSVNGVTGCRSPRIRVRANIYPVPDFPVVDNVTNCGPDTILLTSSPGSNGTISRWYDSLTNGNLISQSNNLNRFVNTTQRFYVSSYNEITHCESSRREITAIILPQPAAITIIGPSRVGVNQNNVIYSVNYNAGSTYEWTIPAGIDVSVESQNFVLLNFPNIGTYNLSVIETNSVGCEGPPAYKPVIVDEDIIVLDLNITNGEACVNTDLQLSVTPSGGTPSYAFAWTGDIQYLNATNTSNPVFSADNPGNYQLIITVNDINSNHNSDTIDIKVFPNPITQIISDTLICAGDNLLLNTNTNGGSGVYSSYNWSGQTSPLSGTNIPDPVFNTYIRGSYDLIFNVRDSHGCAAADSITILNDSPLSSFVSDAIPGCSPMTVNFTNQSDNATDYEWDFGDGNTSNLANPQHSFINQSTSIQYYNVVLRAISLNNCVHTSNEYIIVYPNPALTINTYPATACAPANILLSSTPGGYEYNWDFGDGSEENGNFSILHTFNNTTDRDTIFNIELISTSYFGCEDTGNISITVHPSPVASFTADPLSQMFPDRTVNFSNTTIGDWDYLWRFGDDNISTERDPGSHDYENPGDYLVYLIVKGEHCSDSTWTSIEILPHPPIAAFMPVEPGCMPLTIQFENTSAYSNSFLWEFGDGAVSNKPNPEYTYYEPGTYIIKLTAWGDDRTSDSYSTVNDVYVLPNAFFDIKPRRVYANDQAVLFENQSDNGTFPLDGNTYLWDFGDGTGSTDESPTHTYRQDGEYDVTLNVWTNKGCYDVFEYKTAVLVEPVGKILFPNVFSPVAHLPENRIFKPGLIDYVTEYHLMIFNRWGELIFESFNQDIGWDGYVDGEIAKEDVYIWKVEGNYSNGKAFVQTGDVTLLH